MSRGVLRVAWYRFAATFRRRWGGYLGLVLLIGLVGGTAMASIGAGRRTQSSYPAFLASTNPADLTFSTYGLGGPSSFNRYSPQVTRDIEEVPGVRRVESWVGILAAPLLRDGAPDFDRTAEVNPAGSVDGLYFDEDRATVVTGRMADPSRADEFVTTAAGARLLGAHVGQTIPMGFYGLDQPNLPGFGTARIPPKLRLDMKLVGLVVFNNEVIQDDADRLPTNVLFTPALTRSQLAMGSTQGTWYGLQLARGNRDVARVEHAIIDLLPPGGAAFFFRDTALGEAKVERAVRPEAIALGAFGAIAALATLALAGQAISRQLQADAAEADVLRALGAGPGLTATDGLLGVLGAIVVGSFAACGVAVAASPLAPLGPVRHVSGSIGVAIDWTVLGIGLAVLVGGLGAVAAAIAYRGAPHRAARRSQLARTGRSSLVRAGNAAGLSVPAVVGMRFAFEPGRGRTSVSARSAISGTTVALAMVVTTLTFGSSLHTLVSRPALYGWSWSYAVTTINDVPPPALDLLDHDPHVAAWTGMNYLTLQIDGQNVPALVTDAHPKVTPPILSGHAVAGRDQIVLGAATIALLHKHVGDTVHVSYGSTRDAPLDIPPTPAIIVGTATLPAVSTSATLADHTSMGIGALVPSTLAPASFIQAVSNPDPTLQGPGLVVVQLRKGVPAAVGLADMQRIVGAANKAFAADPAGVGDMVALSSVQRPAEIVNYRTTGATPLVLASGLAVGALAALAFTLVSSVRRRRRDLAMLKTLGFTQRQLAATVAWQASVAALSGIIIGVPLGIVVGRLLWIRFARAIYVVPAPTVPWSLVLVAAGTLVLANLVAAVPGRIAARTPAALGLRAE